MFGLSASHLLILGLILLIFGARRLPELGSSLGKGLRAFKAGMEGPAEPPSQITRENQLLNESNRKT